MAIAEACYLVDPEWFRHPRFARAWRQQSQQSMAHAASSEQAAASLKDECQVLQEGDEYYVHLVLLVTVLGTKWKKDTHLSQHPEWMMTIGRRHRRMTAMRNCTGRQWLRTRTMLGRRPSSPPHHSGQCEEFGSKFLRAVCQ